MSNYKSMIDRGNAYADQRSKERAEADALLAEVARLRAALVEAREALDLAGRRLGRIHGEQFEAFRDCALIAGERAAAALEPTR